MQRLVSGGLKEQKPVEVPQAQSIDKEVVPAVVQRQELMIQTVQ